MYIIKLCLILLGKWDGRAKKGDDMSVKSKSFINGKVKSYRGT